MKPVIGFGAVDRIAFVPVQLQMFVEVVVGAAGIDRGEQEMGRVCSIELQKLIEHEFASSTKSLDR